jgi:hypothetical protein
MTAERWEYRLQQVSGFSGKQVNGKTDAFWGLHTTQYTGSHHLIGVSAEGGWSAFLHNMPGVSFTPGGATGGIHFVYEYQFSGIIFQTGLGAGYQHVYSDIADTVIYHEHMRDTWSTINDAEFTLRHQFYDRHDFTRQIYGQLPLYIGHYISGNSGVGYFLVGAKFNYAFWGNTTQKLRGTTTGLYEKYIGVWEQMDNNGFRQDVPIERHGKQLQLKFDILAHFELGYEHTTYRGPLNYRKRKGAANKDLRFRISGYAECSILDICPKTNNDFYGTPMETIYDFPTYRMEHVFSTTDAKAYWLRNLNAGLRFTVLFGFENEEKCILCNPWRH